MPNWDVPASTYDVPRNLALLDTNVLIAFFDPTDQFHNDTQAVIDMGEYRWAVAQPNLTDPVRQIDHPSIDYIDARWASEIADGRLPLALAKPHDRRARNDHPHPSIMVAARPFIGPRPTAFSFPARDVFISTPTSTAAESYYSTLLHELTHNADIGIMPRRGHLPWSSLAERRRHSA